MYETETYQYFEDVNWGLLRLWGDRKNLDVLDVGCGFATTSQRIAERGNRVTGLESSAEAVTIARERVSDVVHADLQQQDDVKRALAGRRFDVIIFADVLEHLAWPIGILRGYLDLLNEGGSVIISLPNVGLWSVRLNLLLGRFHYEETGVLDRTHLRFFTRRTARELIEQAGLEIVRRTYNPGLVRPFVPLAKKLLGRGASGEQAHDPAALLEWRPYKLYLKTLYPAERAIASFWPGALAFQMIFEGKRSSGLVD
ncbi:MAG: class I SAM-dependent methyltransferase [Acidobacteriota bacterium]|nr:class I SAM-dependent methyltransferase [Acidobacteriota bacterium]